MAKTETESGVYRVTEIIGTSPVSWEEAAKSAVETAATSLCDLRIAEVEKLDVKIEDGKVIAFRAKISLSFKYDTKDDPLLAWKALEPAARLAARPLRGL